MKVLLPIVVPPTNQLGPAMRALNERQQRFVCCLFGQTKRDATAAARAAGYQGDDNTMRVQAHRLTHDPKIKTAIREEGERRLDVLSAMAIDRLGEVLEGSTDHKVILKAVDMTLNRTGFHETSERINRNETVETDGQKVERIIRLATMLGMDPKKLLGRYAPAEGAKPPVEAIDAEFKEVTDVGDQDTGVAQSGGSAVDGDSGVTVEEAHSTEGLEGLL